MGGGSSAWALSLANSLTQVKEPAHMRPVLRVLLLVKAEDWETVDLGGSHTVPSNLTSSPCPRDGVMVRPSLSLAPMLLSYPSGGPCTGGPCA